MRGNVPQQTLARRHQETVFGEVDGDGEKTEESDASHQTDRLDQEPLRGQSSDGDTETEENQYAGRAVRYSPLVEAVRQLVSLVQTDIRLNTNFRKLSQKLAASAKFIIIHGPMPSSSSSVQCSSPFFSINSAMERAVLCVSSHLTISLRRSANVGRWVRRCTTPHTIAAIWSKSAIQD